jgi:hypothetical protein
MPILYIDIKYFIHTTYCACCSEMLIYRAIFGELFTHKEIEYLL